MVRQLAIRQVTTTVASPSVVDSTNDYEGIGFGGNEKKISINSANRTFIAYRKKLAGVYQPYVAYSDDGATWTVVNVATVSGGFLQRVPSVIVGAGDKVHCVWYGQDPNNTGTNQRQIKYSGSTDNGVTWSAWVSVGGDVPGYISSSLWQEHPVIIEDIHTTGMLYVFWEGRDANSQSAQQVKFSMSTDNGVTWSAWINTTSDSVVSSHSRPTIAQMADGSLHVTYYSTNGTTGSVQQIQHVYSNDGGATWSNPAIIGDTGYDSRNSSLISLGSTLLCVWRAIDASYSTTQIKYAIYNGTWSAPVNVSPDSNRWNFFPTLSFVNGFPTCAWVSTFDTSGYTSDNPTSGQIAVSTFNGDTWSPRALVTPGGYNSLYPYMNKVGGLVYIMSPSISSSFSDSIIYGTLSFSRTLANSRTLVGSDGYLVSS